MSDPKGIPGAIAWHDLTTDDADTISAFYREVVGWCLDPVPVGDGVDYVCTADGRPVAGVCRAGGVNADLPRHWLMYVVVEDLDRRLEACVRLGGTVLAGPRSMGGGRAAVIADPSGAACALWEPR